MREFSGLNPTAWICVDQGFVREEVKGLLLRRLKGLSGEVVTSPDAIARKVLGNRAAPERALSRAARQESLRRLLERHLGTGLFSELKRLRRQRRFWERLDQAIQNARLSFAHWDEERVIDERLDEAVGPNLVRQEVRRLAFLWEAWLAERGLWDAPRLLREGCEALRSGRAAGLPGRIYWLRGGTPQPLEEEFFSALGRHVEVLAGWPEGLGSSSSDAQGLGAPASAAERWERWHTIDDAADSLAERLAGTVAAFGGSSLAEVAVLLQPVSEVRRSLKRALAQRGLELEDARDPSRTRWEEGLKWAFAPLEVVARDYERSAVLSWIERGTLGADVEERRRWTREIQERGIVRGLTSYEGGRLEKLAEQLKRLDAAWKGRLRLRELAERHLHELERQGHSRPEAAVWRAYCQRFWDEFVRDERLIAEEGERGRAVPLRVWWERIQDRLRLAQAPVDRLKPRHGVRAYRLGQEMALEAKQVYVLGLDPQWLDAEETGDLWYSSREREWVAREFGVRSRSIVVEDLKASFQRWRRACASFVVLDAQYSFAGAERESIAAVLRELGIECEREERGAHGRWLRSYGALPEAHEPSVQLTPMRPAAEGGKVLLTATAVDLASECSFKALVSARWKLWDGREAEPELWSHVRGRILHAAAERLVRSRAGGPTLEGAAVSEPLSVVQALEQAWEAEPPRGLLRSKRLEKYARDQLRSVLEVFLEKETAYAARSKTIPLVLEDETFLLPVGENIEIQGNPDRIDEHPSGGLFVIDYKSGSQQVKGIDMVETGQRLQLAIYGLAASRKLGRPLMGLQYVELNRAGGRSKGLFFKQWNGKDEGKLTDTRSNNQSLLTRDEGEVWATLQAHIERVALELAAGRYDANPVKEEVCEDCMQRDLCGQRRRSL